MPFGQVDTEWNSLLEAEVTATRLSTIGRNSRVFRLNCSGGQTLIGKAYFRHPSDPRDRLKSEQAGLMLARHAGLDVPDIVLVDEAAGVLIMEHIEGERLSKPARRDVICAVDFLETLRRVAESMDGPESVPIASEACFCGRQLEQVLTSRLGRIKKARGDEPEYRDLKLLLMDIEAALRKRLKAARTGLQNNGYDWSVPIEQACRILSPSDFGFHNAVRRPDGRICFLDFEYFGWDDPAKTVCDFVLHPAMNLEVRWQALFVRQALARLNVTGVRLRSRCYYPLYALKWCIILLNEFIPAEMERRTFSGGTPRRRALAGQLQKARNILERLDETHDRFCSWLA